MNTKTHKTFLRLVRLGIGRTDTTEITDEVDWVALKALADEQGLTAIVLDGIDKLNTNLSNSMNTLPIQMKLEWIGEVLQNYEQRYKDYEKTISSLAGFYNQHGFKMMVLKGYACSLDWPKPEHRPCGDIDIWQFGKQKEADETLQKLSRIGELENKASTNTNRTDNTNIFEIDNSHHQHTVFEWRGFTVENHYDFVNVHYNQSNSEIEKVFKKLGEDDSYNIDVNGEKVYIPSPNLHALFLLRHAMVEFASSGITLRNIMDWAFFVKSHGKEVDWEWLEGVLEEYGMERMYDVFNSICVEDLGFDINLFTQVKTNHSLKEEVLNELLTPAIPNQKPKDLFSRIIWKYGRWKANEWKRKLVYKENSNCAFWNGVWNHLLKPKTI